MVKRNQDTYDKIHFVLLLSIEINNLTGYKNTKKLTQWWSFKAESKVYEVLF